MLEGIILGNLIHNDAYIRKVLHHLQEEYFEEPAARHSYQLIDGFMNKYNERPTKEALHVELLNRDDLNEAQFKEDKQYLDNLTVDKATNFEWLIAQTEEFCKSAALRNALGQSIEIASNENKNLSTGAIPQILERALAVSFDDKVGHDYLDDWMERFKSYKEEKRRLPFDLEYFNKITKGGLLNKTLNLLMAGTGIGKSMTMCHLAAKHLELGKNVLYITLEMSDMAISQRIDANLLDISLNDFETIPEDIFAKKMKRLREKTVGKLVVKEYPNGAASAATFRHLLSELRLKKNFKPDIIYIDYLNICSSSRIKLGGSINSYTYIKSIAEELRALAVEHDLPIVTATQTNREGQSNSNITLENTSESIGLPQTVDLMLALYCDEQLSQLGKMHVIQLKNRYNDLNYYRRFAVGVDKVKMRFYDVEQTAQDEIIDDTPVMDKTNFARDDNPNFTVKRRPKTKNKLS